MAPNTLNKFRKIPQHKIEQVFGGRSTGLQGWKWITIIDFWTGCPEIQVAILVTF